jgi:hypothetical protein
MAKGRQLHIAVTIPHPLPSPKGVTQKGLSFAWCGQDTKNVGYGVILEIEMVLGRQAKFL